MKEDGLAHTLQFLMRLCVCCVCLCVCVSVSVCVCVECSDLVMAASLYYHGYSWMDVNVKNPIMFCLSPLETP